MRGGVGVKRKTTELQQERKSTRLSEHRRRNLKRKCERKNLEHDQQRIKTTRLKEERGQRGETGHTHDTNLHVSQALLPLFLVIDTALLLRCYFLEHVHIHIQLTRARSRPVLQTLMACSALIGS